MKKESIIKINDMIEKLEKINAEADADEVDTKVDEIIKKHGAEKLSSDDVSKYSGEYGIPVTTLMIKLKEKGVYAMTYEDVVAWYLIGQVEEQFPKLKEGMESEAVEDLSPMQKKYQDYFEKKMEKHDIESPTELKEEEKKDFFEDVKQGWKKGEGPKTESKLKLKDILAKVDAETKKKIIDIIKADSVNAKVKEFNSKEEAEKYIKEKKLQNVEVVKQGSKFIISIKAF